MPLTAFERESVVSFNDGEQTASVYTAQRRIITKLKKNPAATLVEEGKHDGSAWARFDIPASMVSFRSVKGRMGDEQREASASRLRPVDSGFSTAEAA